jgi:hypothetical protein
MHRRPDARPARQPNQRVPSLVALAPGRHGPVRFDRLLKLRQRHQATAVFEETAGRKENEKSETLNKCNDSPDL